MAGEKFEINLDNMVDIGQDIIIDDKGEKVPTENDILKEKGMLLGKNKEVIKDGDIIRDDDGEIKIFDSKKHNKKVSAQKHEEGKESTKDNEDIEDNEEAHQEEKKMPSEKKEVNSFYSPYAESLKEDGILPDLNIEEFNKLPKEKQVESLITSYKEGIDKGVNSWIENQPPVLKDILQGLKELGSNVPLVELIQLESDKMELSNLSEEDIKDDETIQEDLVKTHMSETTRYNDEKIKKEIVRLKANGELYDEAIDARKELYAIREEEKKKKLEDAQKQKKIYDEERTKYIKDISERIDKISEIFPNIKVNDAQKKELKQWMTTPVGYTKDKHPVSKVMEVRNIDPKEFDIRLLHYIQLGYFNKNIDISKIEKNANSKAVKKLADILERTNTFITHDNDTEGEKKKEKNTDLIGLKNLDRMVISR